MSCPPEILICFLLTGLSLIQIPSSEGAIGPVQAYQNNASTTFQFVRNILDELFPVAHHDAEDGKHHFSAKSAPHGHKSENEIQCVEHQKVDVATKEPNYVIHKTDKHFIKKKQLKSFWDGKQDFVSDNFTNEKKHKITKRQAAVYFHQRTDEELDYRDHWHLGLKQAFFNTLTYVEKRVHDDEKRYKLWMKIKRSRFLKRKMLMGIDGAEHNKYGVIINRNVKFEIRQTDGAIYECISKTCKPDHDVTAVWKIRTIDSDNIERDVLPSDSEQNDKYYATGTRQRHLRYHGNNNRRSERTRRHTINYFSVNLNSKIRSKRDLHEKIEDNFNIEEKLKLDNDLTNEEVTRYKRNRSLFQQNNRDLVRVNNNDQSQSQTIPYQSTQRLYPVYENISPSPKSLVFNDDPWKPIETTQYYSPDVTNKDSFTRYIQDESLEYLSAKEKYKIPLDSFDPPRTYPDLSSQKMLQSWKAQPIILTNAYKTPKVVQLLPFPKQVDLSGIPLEVTTNYNNLKTQPNIIFDSQQQQQRLNQQQYQEQQQEHHKSNQQQIYLEQQPQKQQPQQQQKQSNQQQIYLEQQPQQQQKQSNHQQIYLEHQQQKHYQPQRQQPQQPEQQLIQQLQHQQKPYQTLQKQQQQNLQNQQQKNKYEQSQKQQNQQNEQQQKPYQPDRQQQKQYQQNQQQQKQNQNQKNQQPQKQYQQNQQSQKQYQQNQQPQNQYQQNQQPQNQYQQNQQPQKQYHQNQQQQKQYQQQQNQKQPEYSNSNKAQYVKTPVLPTQMPESSSQILQKDLNSNSNYFTEQNGNLGVQVLPASIKPNKYEKIQDPLNKPWMSLRINSVPNSKTMMGENSANYAKIQTYTPGLNDENVRVQNIPSNIKNFKPRFIDDTDINISNIPNSRFKPKQNVYLDKNLPYDIKIPQVPLTSIKTENPVKEILSIREPEYVKIPFNTFESDTRVIPLHIGNENDYEQLTTKSDTKIEYSTEPTIWSKLPIVKPEPIGQIRSNQIKNDELNIYHDPNRSRNIDPSVNFDQKSKEINPGENLRVSEEMFFNHFDEIKSNAPINLDVNDFGNKGPIGIINQNEQTSQRTMDTQENYTLTSKDLHENKDFLSHTQDDSTDEEEEEDDYDGEYDEYQEDDYEDTDKEPQIIKTSIQHCKALAKNTLILSRNKNLKFIIKPMLIFFKTNFDNFVKEHCYLYTTEKDLKILNNDLNLEAQGRQNKRILRSKTNKRNIKKKYKLKNYKIYRNNDYDESIEDSGHDSYRDSFETYGKKRKYNSGSHFLKPNDHENQKSINNFGLSDVTYGKQLVPSKNIKSHQLLENDREIVPDKKKIEKIHHLFKNNEDHISALKLDSVNFSDDIQGIRRIDDGPYSIIIYPKILLKDNDELQNAGKNNKQKIQSRSDIDTDVEYLEDTRENSLKNNKKFRFPTEYSFVTQDRISSEDFLPVNDKDDTRPIVEKFTLKDLIPLRDNQKPMYSGTRNEQVQSTEQTISNTIKFPQMESFFTNNQNSTNHYTEFTNPQNKIAISGSKRHNSNNKNDEFNIVNNDKYFKPKGQVIDEIIYIPNHPLHELFNSKIPQPSKENYVDKKHVNHKVTVPQTLSVIPRFEDNKNIIVSSQILVGKHADKTINAEEFARDNTGTITSDGEKHRTETIRKNVPLIKRRQDDMDFITAEISKTKHEFGPILKDGFLPILPMINKTISQSEYVHTMVTPENKMNPQQKRKPGIVFEETLKRTQNNEDFNPSTKPKLIEVTTSFTEPMRTNFFKIDSASLTPTKMNISQKIPSTDTRRLNMTRSTNNNFKPSFSFTMYSEPDPSHLQPSDMVKSVNTETQTEDGQFMYTTERNNYTEISINKNKTMHNIDFIKIVGSKFFHTPPTSKNNENLNKSAINEKENGKNKDYIFKPIQNYSNDSKFSLTTDTIKTSDTGKKVHLPKLGDEENHNNSNSTVSYSNSSLLENINNTLNGDEKANPDNIGYMMQLFPDAEKRDKETERYSSEVSNKASTKSQKEIVSPGQIIFLQKTSKETGKTNELGKEFIKDTSRNEIITRSPNEILIKNIKNQREKLFLEKNIMNYVKNNTSKLEDNFRIVKSYSESSPNNTEGAIMEHAMTTIDPLFFYETVTSIIEKTPVTTNEYSENTQETNFIITTAFPTTTHNFFNDRHDIDSFEALAGSSTILSTKNIENNILNENKLSNIKESPSKLNKTNSKAQFVGKTYDNLFNVNTTDGFKDNQDHTTQNSLEQLKPIEVLKIDADYSTISSGTFEKSENHLAKNIIVESFGSYKSDNSTKTPLRMFGHVKTKNDSHSINNQYLKATTFHPIHLKSTTVQTNDGI